MTDFKKYEGSIIMIFIMGIMALLLIVVGLNIIGPALYQLGIIAFEGSAPYIAQTINFAFERDYGLISPIHFSDNSILFQIYCGDLCASNLRHLYRKGVAVKDSLECRDSYCVCLATIKRSEKEDFIKGRQQYEDIQQDTKIHYIKGNARDILEQSYEYFLKGGFEEGNEKLERINCAPSETFLVVQNEECSRTNTCFFNVLTYIYADGTYTFSARLEKSPNNIGVGMRE